jgi:hypothetical protein
MASDERVLFSKQLADKQSVCDGRNDNEDEEYFVFPVDDDGATTTMMVVAGT